VGVFVVYALGACRTIYVGDSGELVTAVAVLGIPHPSGYPLYVLLGKLWTVLVPVGSIAFRMSLFSAFCAALACGVLYRLAREAAQSVPAALLSALLLAFSPTFWAEANVAGNLPAVYALRSLGRRQATEILEPAKRRRPRASWELRGATRRPVSPFGHELLQAATASRRSIAQVLTVGRSAEPASASRQVSLAPASAPTPGRRPFADLPPIDRNRRYGGTERVP